MQVLSIDPTRKSYPDLKLFMDSTEELRQKKAEKYKDGYAKVKGWLSEYEADSSSLLRNENQLNE